MARMLNQTDTSAQCWSLQGEEAMVAFGAELGQACRELAEPGGQLIFLEGDLGMGKTTLSRGILQAYGHHGAVKSPTYTLVEPYEFSTNNVYHFDLYRLGDPEELEYMGIRDYFDGNNLCLVEWAEKGAMFLPQADLVVRIRLITGGRSVEIQAQSTIGEAVVDGIAR